jgi:16S rRNA (cytosine1402-N4)-methyltransferase
MAQTTSNDGGPYHVPVMVREVVEFFAPAADGLVVDATFGGGGHSLALLAAYPNLRVLGLDRDPDAVANAPQRARLRVATANFARLGETLADELGSDRGHSGAVEGVFFDLGVSSHQLDTPARGFSYHHAGPLDMRMGPDAGLSAEQPVNEWDAADVERAIRRFGEERYARRIAQNIVRNRPIADTAELAAVVAAAVPAPARRKRHPARRVFQALRIAVNAELEALAGGLDAALAWLRPGGRLVVIAYHSLEDRIVKRRFLAGAGGCVCPPDLPVCGCDQPGELQIVTRSPVRPTSDEIAANQRARSALLRVVAKVAT